MSDQIDSTALPQRGRYYFSQQMAGWGGHFLFMATVGLTVASLLGSFRGAQLHLLVLLTALAIYALLGTVGWHRSLSQHSARAVRRYFIGQFVLVTLLMAFELAVGVMGLTTTILGSGLMLQASVLPLRARLGLLLGLLLLAVPLYAQSMRVGFAEVQQIASYFLIFGALYAVGLFLGLLIVREERARETSRRLDESNRKLALYAVEVENLSTLRERNRLAREIHDNIGHYLTAINMQLEVALISLSKDHEPAQAALLKAQTLTKEALTEIRRSISALRATPIENRALHEAIALLVEEHRAAGNTVEFQMIGVSRPCSAPIEMAVYRIAQEALTNVRKHSAGGSARVTLSYSDAGAVALQVQDDGQGTEGFGDGFGLMGIRERVQLFGGTVAIETAQGRGFTLRVVIPG